MNKRYTAIFTSIAGTLNDFTLDFAINKFNMHRVLAITSFLAMIGQLLIGLVIGIKVTPESIPYVLLYGAIMLGAYISYVKALKIMPIGLTGLIQSGDLFIILMIDVIIGYLNLTPKFILLFMVYVVAVIIFSLETNRIHKEEHRFSIKKLLIKIFKIITFRYKKEDKIIKRVTLSGIMFIIFSMLLYCFEPYLIKFISSKGANEVAINLGYYIFATTYFMISYLRSRKETVNKEKREILNKKLLLICVLIACFETLYYIFSTISYINDVPIIVYIIQSIRVFLLVILSTVFKTDKMSTKKVIAIILAMIAVLGLYFS